jgi:hypothetical protein
VVSPGDTVWSSSVMGDGASTWRSSSSSLSKSTSSSAVCAIGSVCIFSVGAAAASTWCEARRIGFLGELIPALRGACGNRALDTRVALFLQQPFSGLGFGKGLQMICEP